MNIDELLRNLDVDVRTKLSSFSSTGLHRLISVMTKSMGKTQMAGFLCDTNYFDSEKLLKALGKTGGKRSQLLELLDEPKDEKQMEDPVATDLRKKGLMIATQVPLPKKGRARPRRIDVAGYKKGRFLGSVTVTGVELKSQVTRGAIDAAFSQAKDYSEYCEESVVCFSPFVYYRYADDIESRRKKYGNLGVWIASKKRVVRILQEASAMSISDKKQNEIVEYISSGKR